MSPHDQTRPPQGEPSHGDQRSSPRSSLMLRTAKVVCQSGEYVCIVKDVSEEGVGLRFLHAAPREPRIILELANGATYPVERVWTGKRQAGFRFAGPIDLHEFIHEPSPYQARPIRLRLSIPATLGTGKDCADVRLLDLSSGGAMVEAETPLGKGSILRLEVDAQLSKLAEVCWVEENRHGLTFLQPMTNAELANTALALQPYEGTRHDLVGSAHVAAA